MQKTKLPLTKEEFDSIYSKVTRLNVELLVRIDDGIILTKRSIEPQIGKWHIPGGTVRFGETLHAAVKRVAYEELEVEVEVGQQVGYIEYPIMCAEGYKGWPIGVAFECTIISGVPTGTEQGEEIGFFKEVPENTIEDQRLFLESLEK